jgi:hypothetical protein
MIALAKTFLNPCNLPVGKSNDILSFKWLLVFFLIFISKNNLLYAGEISIWSSNLESCAGYTIDFSGEVKRGDFRKLENAINAAHRKYGKENCSDGWLPVRISSEGGDVAESIAMGKLIRDNKLRTIVPQGASCNSACVFIFAGGVRRFPMGEIGIHRPYFANLDPSHNVNRVRVEREKINSMIREYLLYVDIPLSLLDAMLSTPPEKIKYLGDSELDFYRLSGTDPSFEEYRVAQQANFYGLSSAQYRANDALVTKKCTKNNLFDVECYTAGMLQITVTELRKRQEIAEKKCHLQKANDCYGKYLRGAK